MSFPYRLWKARIHVCFWCWLSLAPLVVYYRTHLPPSATTYLPCTPNFQDSLVISLVSNVLVSTSLGLFDHNLWYFHFSSIANLILTPCADTRDGPTLPDLVRHCVRPIEDIQRRALMKDWQYSFPNTNLTNGHPPMLRELAHVRNGQGCSDSATPTWDGYLRGYPTFPFI